MGYSCCFLTSFFLLIVLLNATNGQPLVSALFIFGDSNNKLFTIAKANFPTYGRDFKNHNLTGRFCNGKLAIHFVAEFVGFTFYPPAYFNFTKGKNLLNGANFASSCSGYYGSTSKLYGTISLNQQLKYYKDYQNELVKIAGQSNALSIISGAIYIVGVGSNDFALNYYINPLLNKNLYALGARKMGVTTLPPIGCLPLVITTFGSYSNECVARLNDAINFNEKVKVTSQNLRKLLPGLNLVVLDVFQPLYDIITKPSKYGFSEARKACCGMGLLEASILCNKAS